jgi:hypothetical protein
MTVKTVLILVFLSGLAAAQEDITQRPGPDSGPTKIWFAAYIIDVHSISSTDQSFTANLFYRLRWHDPRLAGLADKTVNRPLDEIWNPQHQITNQQRVWKTFPEQAEVSPEGEVLYRQRVWGIFSQPLDLIEFPFDRHYFTVQFVFVGHRSDEIQLLVEPELSSGIASRLTLADWKVHDLITIPKLYEPLPDFPALPGFAISFGAERKIGYYFFKIILPLLFIVMMSWIVFWIDPSLTAVQISVSVTSMLTLIAYRFMISGFLPRISYLTHLDQLVIGATTMVFAVLVEAVYTSILVNQKKTDKALAVDRKCRIVFPALFVLLITATLLM